jgi:hypothetical protein
MISFESSSIKVEGQDKEEGRIVNEETKAMGS